jgi:hypothetical protein
VDGGCFAGSVRTDEAGNAAGGNLHGEIVDRNFLSEFFRDVFAKNHVIFLSAAMNTVSNSCYKNHTEVKFEMQF